MSKEKFPFESALEQLDFGYGLPLYSFTLAEIAEIKDRLRVIHKAMVNEGLDRLPELLDEE